MRPKKIKTGRSKHSIRHKKKTFSVTRSYIIVQVKWLRSLIIPDTFNQQSGYTSEDWKPTHKEQIPKSQNYKTGKTKENMRRKKMSTLAIVIFRIQQNANVDSFSEL